MGRFVTSLLVYFFLWLIVFNVQVSGMPGKFSTRDSLNTKSCYLCLTRNESALGENKTFAPEILRTNIACGSFTSKSLHDYVFPCPMQYVECFERISGATYTGSCSTLSLNNCKIANDVELCYCSAAFCNVIHSDRSWLDSKIRTQNSKIWRSEETGDDDVLGPKNPHFPLDNFNQEEMQGDSGPGDPPGVVRVEETTKKPKLIPNLPYPGRLGTRAPTTNIATSFSVFTLWRACFILRIIL